MKKHWLAVVSLEHAQVAFKSGFLQVCHGRAEPLRRAAVDDDVFVYCPKTAMENGKSLMSVHFRGRFASERLYNVEMFPGFAPWRRDVAFDASFKPIDIRRIAGLRLTAEPSWGLALRRGFIELRADDAARIAEKSRALG